METSVNPVEPLTADSRDALAHYRRTTPSTARARANWEGVEHKLSHEEAGVDVEVDDPDPQDSAVWIRDRQRSRVWARGAKSALTSVAIAAGVLLGVRGVVSGVETVSQQAKATATQAADLEETERADGTWRRRPHTATPSSQPQQATVVEAPGEVPRPAAVDAPAVAPSVSPGSGPSADSVPDPSATPAEAPAPVRAATLAEQTRLLVQARTALADGRFADARRLSGAYRRQYSSGALLEEHGAIESVAECELGQAPQRARAFLLSYPASPHVARVRAACGALE